MEYNAQSWVWKCYSIERWFLFFLSPFLLLWHRSIHSPNLSSLGYQLQHENCKSNTRKGLILQCTFDIELHHTFIIQYIMHQFLFIIHCAQTSTIWVLVKMLQYWMLLTVFFLIAFAPSKHSTPSSLLPWPSTMACKSKIQMRQFLYSDIMLLSETIFIRT